MCATRRVVHISILTPYLCTMVLNPEGANQPEGLAYSKNMRSEYFFLQKKRLMGVKL